MLQKLHLYLFFDYNFIATPKHSAFCERTFKCFIIIFFFRMLAPPLPVKITVRVNQASPRKDIDVCVLMVGQVEHVTWVTLMAFFTKHLTISRFSCLFSGKKMYKKSVIHVHSCRFTNLSKRTAFLLFSSPSPSLKLLYVYTLPVAQFSCRHEKLSRPSKYEHPFTLHKRVTQRTLSDM